MNVQQKRKYTKRNFDQEADFQIKILEQKAREDFLENFSQFEETAPRIEEVSSGSQREEVETKVYIPAQAKSLLEKWMYDHRLYCYPTKAEKQALALETGLSIQKISNWFINSRRRMLPKVYVHICFFFLFRFTQFCNQCLTHFLYRCSKLRDGIRSTSLFRGRKRRVPPLQ